MSFAARFLLLLVLAFLPQGATAAPVTVLMTGVWTTFSDTGNVLDSSIALNKPYTLTFTYDDSVPDTNPSPGFGNYTLAAGTYTMNLVTGNYLFAPTPVAPTGITVINGPSDSVGAQTQPIVGSGPGMPTFSTPSYLTPSASGMPPGTFPSAALVGLPWSATLGYLEIYLFAPYLGGSEFIELASNPTSIVVVPEPGTLALLLVGLTLLAQRARAR